MEIKKIFYNYMIIMLIKIIDHLQKEIMRNDLIFIQRIVLCGEKLIKYMDKMSYDKIIIDGVQRTKETYEKRYLVIRDKYEKFYN